MTDTIYNWNQAPVSNATSDATTPWPEYMNPDQVNDSARAMMARVAAFVSDLAPKRTSTGAGNNYIVTSDAAGATLRDGEIVCFFPDKSNTGVCTLTVDGRPTKPFRPKIGTEFTTNSVIVGVPVIAFYSLATDEWIGVNTGYHVNVLTAGLAAQAVVAQLPKIGDMVLSMSATPAAGRIRLGETTLNHLKSDWPQLNTWLSGQGYPFGSSATYFTLPAAAGYALRFAASSAAIDPAGPRLAGSTQSDAFKNHLHTFTGNSVPDHTHTVYGNSGSVFDYAGGGGSHQLAATVATSPAGGHTPSGSISSVGDAETRGKNVAYHVDIIASSAAAAADIAMFGFPYQWDSGVAAADPGSGRIRVNNASPDLATSIVISTMDRWAVNLSALIAAVAVGSHFHISKVGGQANRVSYRVTALPVISGSFATIPVAVLLSSGALSNNDNMTLEITPSGVGVPGPLGPNTGLDYLWSSSTSGDPTGGFIGGNSATPASITSLRVSKNGRNGELLGAVIALWDDSTTVANKGHLRIFAVSNRVKYLEVTVTGSMTDNGTYWDVPVSIVAVGTPLAASDVVSVAFERTGDGVGVPSVPTLVGAVALPASSSTTIYVEGRLTSGDGYAGFFRWRAGNNTALVTADPQKGIWIAPGSDPTGASGVWERIVSDHTFEVPWFGSIGSGADETTKVQSALTALGARNGGAGGTITIPRGVKFNLATLVFPARSSMRYWIDDDLSSPSLSGDLGSSEQVFFSANSSYPLDSTGATVNEWRYTAPFHPGVILDVRKDVPGHDAYLRPGQSRTDPARASIIMQDTQMDAFSIQYVQHLGASNFSAVNVAVQRRTVLLEGVGTGNWTSVPPINTVVTGATSGAKGYVLDVSATRTTLMWLSGKFAVGEALIDDDETTTATPTAVSLISTPTHPLSQDLQRGNWSIGLPPGSTRDVLAVGGKIAAARTRTLGQFIEETILDPGFVVVDSYENSPPNGYEIVYDTFLAPNRRRMVLRKLNQSQNLANIGACRLHTSFNNSVIPSDSSFNVASVARVGVGQYTVTPTVAWAIGDYGPQLTCTDPMDTARVYDTNAGVLTIRVYTTGTSTLRDLTSYLHVACFGGDI